MFVILWFLFFISLKSRLHFLLFLQFFFPVFIAFSWYSQCHSISWIFLIYFLFSKEKKIKDSTHVHREQWPMRRLRFIRKQQEIFYCPTHFCSYTNMDNSQRDEREREKDDYQKKKGNREREWDEERRVERKKAEWGGEENMRYEREEEEKRLLIAAAYVLWILLHHIEWYRINRNCVMLLVYGNLNEQWKKMK